MNFAGMLKRSLILCALMDEERLVYVVAAYGDHVSRFFPCGRITEADAEEKRFLEDARARAEREKGREK